MKVTELLKKEKPCLSFEFFPPKNPEQEEQLFKTLTDLKKFNPDFVSVTYGAMGSNRERSFFWVSEIKNRFGIEPVAHLTCVAASKNEIEKYLDELEGLGVQNILALRGDPPEGQKDFIPPADGFKFAKELISFIGKNKPGMCVGAAGFPEGHITVPDLQKDVEYLKQKIDSGAEYIITQLFFDNKYFFDFVDRCRKAGINVPIIPGLMPIIGNKQIKRITEMCGATIPKELHEKLDRFQDDHAAIKKIGAEQTLKQAEDLLKNKVSGLHFFVMNQSEPISGILKQLRI
ncbi:MAG: methylenetetrahydrofolate reductase [NAD(P)H] [Candidatus Margulisiibacteriota bacterium]